MKQTEMQINAADGTLLRITHRIPQNFKAVALVVHGLGEHSGRYGEAASFLNKRGFAVFMYDHRGHGKSGGQRAHIMSFDDYLSDLSVVAGKAMDTTKTGRFLLFGHSMGGLIAASFAGRKPGMVSGLVLSSPYIGAAIKIPAAKAVAGKLLSRVLPGLSMATGLPPEHLSHDTEVVNAYINDPLVTGKVSARWFTEILRGQAAVFGDVKAYTGPLLMIQGGDDRLVSVADSKALFEASASPDKELRVLEGFFHEVFNEVERKVAFDILDDWLERHPGLAG